MQTVRTITVPAGADLNFTWEVKDWVREHESFYCCAIVSGLAFTLCNFAPFYRQSYDQVVQNIDS